MLTSASTLGSKEVLALFLVIFLITVLIVFVKVLMFRRKYKREMEEDE